MSSAGVTPINVQYPEAGDLVLRIVVGACRIRIKPGEGPAWVTGSYDDAAGALPLRVQEDGNTLRITQSYSASDMLNLMNRVPLLDLSLGKRTPYSIVIETGASESVLDLGGLPLRRLEIRLGAGKHELRFSAANPQDMSVLSIGAGAGSIEAYSLADANFGEATIEGGAAAYKLDFDGRLRRDGRVRVSAGMSSLELIVPASTPARISTETLMGGLDIGDGFTRHEGVFLTRAAVGGGAPALTMRVSVALGALRMRTK